MLLRIALVILWFATGWMCGAMTTYVVGLPVWVAPVAAMAAAGFIGWWSGRPEWHGRRSQPVKVTLPPVARTA